MVQDNQARLRPPRDDIVRAISPGYELREASEPGGMPTLYGHFARFGEWTRIDSAREGTFMEQIAPSAFDKTFAENRNAIRVTFNHGHDPHLGDKVLGPIEDLRSDEEGAYYEVPLFDTQYNRELLPGLESGQYGASFRFRVMREDIEQEPERSDYNPEGIPERTIREAQVMEFGPVTFPAYAGATAGVRSLTDEYVMRQLTQDAAHLADLIDYIRTEPVQEVSATPAESTSQERTTPPPDAPQEAQKEREEVDIDQFRTVEDLAARRDDIDKEMESLDADAGVSELTAEAQAEWDALKEEREAIERRIEAKKSREAYLRDKVEARHVEEPAKREVKSYQVKTQGAVPDNIYDVDAYRMNARTPTELHQALRDGAMKSVEGATFDVAVNREHVQGHVAHLLDTIDAPDEEMGKAGSELARRILLTGSPTYRRAFGKHILGRPMSPEEQRALSFASAATGAAAVVYQLDPTIVPTSNSSVNPYRAISRVETISGTNEFKFATSGAITAAYAAEVTEASDNAPTLAQPDIIVEKAQAYVPFSIEIGQDWGALEVEMGRLFAEAKDDLEATKFTTGAGHGSTEPKGIITAATTTVAPAGGVGTFAIADLYAMLEALPPRFRSRASWLGNLFIYDKVRQFDTSGGSGVWIAPQGLVPPIGGNDAGAVSVDVGARLLGKPAYEASAMDNALTTGKKPLVIGDFGRYFVIVDRVGMNVEVLPLVVGTNHRPTGQRGLYAYWRNSSDVLSAAAFRVLAEP